MGGASRVELCAGIPEGGTTPSYGEIKTAQALTSTIDINVIIRPRGGDFLYTEAEVEAMLLDIELCKQLGVHGVVFGCLTSEGDIDVPLMRRLIEAAKPLSVTCHRAFDVCRDPFAALEQLIEYRREGHSPAQTAGRARRAAHHHHAGLRRARGQHRPHRGRDGSPGVPHLGAQRGAQPDALPQGGGADGQQRRHLGV